MIVKSEHSESTSRHGFRLPTLQFVLHDLEPHLLATAQLVQILQPTTLRHQILIAHPAPDILHRCTPLSDPHSFGSVNTHEKKSLTTTTEKSTHHRGFNPPIAR